MGTYRQPYMKPTAAGQLNKCEYIEEMRKTYFRPPKQTERTCDGYRNRYTGGASHVCEQCEWFSGNQGDRLNDRSRADKGAE